METHSKTAEAVDLSIPIENIQQDSIAHRQNEMSNDTGSLLSEEASVSPMKNNPSSVLHSSQNDENDEAGGLSPPIQPKSSPSWDSNMYDFDLQTPDSISSNGNVSSPDQINTISNGNFPLLPMDASSISDIRLNSTLDLLDNENQSSTDGSTSASSNSSPGTSRIRRRKPSHRQNRRRSVPSVPETIEERRSLRQSLDAGMITLRRFLSPGGASSSTTSRPTLSRASQSALSSRDDLTLLVRPTTTSLERQSQTFSLLQFHEGASRQRALSEPEGQLRDYYFQQVMMEDQRGGGSIPPPQQLQQTSQASANSTLPNQQQEDSQQLREARNRWYNLNRRFHVCITVVAFIFSLLLFAVLICWVVFTSAYFISLDKPCDIPVKVYYWLASAQLLLDVFRKDIIRVFCRWSPNSSSETHRNCRIPARAILYHVAYVVYALFVLRLGVKSTYFASEDSSCYETAPELYIASRVFVYLSIAVWCTILFGYIIPFCVVATLLTWNGYHPNADMMLNFAQGGATGVFPTSVNPGAPPNTIERFRPVILRELPSNYPRECCICLVDFSEQDSIVATPDCDHIFHKSCCEQWLKHACTCPVCRKNLVLENCDEENQTSSRPFRVRSEPHLEIVNFLSRLRSDAISAAPSSLNNREVDLRAENRNNEN
mmetsp:Transcript_18326/g.27144  ORF Transcript_18326/g.27144 Transcript_18326/m.27144 type:complete len:659 (-) Transcript_18326:86-2062(-)